jgi:hypothetical protein
VTPHLTPAQFVDAAEGAQHESALAHLTACDACRREVADLRAMMSDAAAADVPEPSPLFWNQLSSRVHDAVAEQPVQASWRAWLRQPRVFVPSLAGALAVALTAVLVTRTPIDRTIPATPLPIAGNAAWPSLSPSLPPIAPLGSADDPQLTIVAAVATTIDWDEMREEVAPATTSDAVAASLTPDEQRELKRLLAYEMAQPDALEKRS